MKPEHVYKKVTTYGTIGTHTRHLLNSVSKLDRKIALLQAITVEPNPSLYRAVAGIESSAWRGKAAKQAAVILQRTSQYVDRQLRGVTISVGGGVRSVEHVTFGGSTAPVNVVIHNGLSYKVNVGLIVQASNATVTGQPPTVTIPPHNSSFPVKLTVHVNGSHARLRLTLTAPPSGNRPGHPLPAAPLTILIHPTEFGLIALIIVAIALAIFVIASAFRAIRHGRPRTQEEPGSPEGPDDSSPADLGKRPEHTDSVSHEQPELTPTGPAAADQEPAATSWRANQEHR
jgi:hypothetical protein